MNIRNFEPRDYQLNIVSSCISKNTLVVLPTGLGKTKIAVMLSVNVIGEKGGIILVLAPTRPLASQIANEFREFTDIEPEKISLVTGVINKKDRKLVYEKSLIIVGTPQTINNDIDDIFPLSSVSLIVVDEVHRAVKQYAYTQILKRYSGQVLGLTASPGSDQAKINEICKNLGINHIEIRDENDVDVARYVQKKLVEYAKVELSGNMKKISDLLRAVYQQKLRRLGEISYLGSLKSVNRRVLLSYQNYLRKSLKKGNPTAYYSISLVAQLLKISYAIELFETQGLRAFADFMDKLREDDTKAARVILGDDSITNAVLSVKKLVSEGIVHPKMEKLREILFEQFKNNKNSRVIIFANFRNTTKEIFDYLSNFEYARPIELVGQKEGLKQSEQIKRIDDFSSGKYNCLITTSIGEEGLSIKEADLAVFYDHTSMSVRRIQRSGRVGRVSPGKIIYLLVKGTRDESLYWASHYGVKRMKKALCNIKESEGLNNFI